MGKENGKTLAERVLQGFRVPGAGVEPAQPCGHWCLRPTRLPIPPSGQTNCKGIANCLKKQLQYDINTGNITLVHTDIAISGAAMQRTIPKVNAKGGQDRTRQNEDFQRPWVNSMWFRSLSDNKNCIFAGWAYRTACVGLCRGADGLLIKFKIFNNVQDTHLRGAPHRECRPGGDSGGLGSEDQKARWDDFHRLEGQIWYHSAGCR